MVRNTLDSLPKDLNETYDRLLKSIEAKNFLDDAIWLLQWLCFAKRPLLLSELAEVHAVRAGQDGGFDPERKLFDLNEVLRICSSFVVQTGAHPAESESESESETARWTEIRLSHSSVREYLMSNRCPIHESFNIDFATPKIGEACVHYLLHLASRDEIDPDTLAEHSLTAYAALNWWKHTSQGHDTVLLQLATKLTLEKSKALYLWSKLLLMFEDHYPFSKIDLAGPLHYLDSPIIYIIRTGWYPLVKMAISKTENLEFSQQMRETALQVAVKNGFVAIVQLLLESGADPDGYGRVGGTPLQCAAAIDEEEIAKLLIERGADLSLNVNGSMTPLVNAAFNGNLSMARLLLKHGADIDQQESSVGTALVFAASRGHQDTVQLLLDHGATVNSTMNVLTPLQAATMRSSLPIMKLILAADDDVDVVGQHGDNALMTAIDRGLEDAMDLLLDHGADPNSLGPDGRSLLTRAAFNGHENMVRRLIQLGADQQRFGPYGAALHEAAEKGHQDAVRQILGQSDFFDGDLVDSDVSLAFRAAISMDHVDIVSLLLSSGVDVHALGGSDLTPLTVAAEHGKDEMVQLLLDYGARSSGHSNDFPTSALVRAAGVGRASTVQLLLMYGAMPNEFDYWRGTAVESAFYNEHWTIGELLIQVQGEGYD